jgi:predicted amidohydrolase
MDTTIKIAGMQIEPHILEKERNLTRSLDLIKTASKRGTELIVFPEAMLTGYIYESLEAAFPVMETSPGPTTDYRIIIYLRHNAPPICTSVIREKG